jgi:hypothetical protein
MTDNTRGRFVVATNARKYPYRRTIHRGSYATAEEAAVAAQERATETQCKALVLRHNLRGEPQRSGWPFEEYTTIATYLPMSLRTWFRERITGEEAPRD